MSAPVSGRKTPVDHGVQIRFINDLQDTGGGVSGQPRKEAPKKLPSRYGVAVRVQDIGGQHYVVLKEGLKGDSYGVQLRTQPPAYSKDGVIQGPYFSSGENTALRRAQSHGSLLDRENASEDSTDQLRRPLGDGRSGSYGNLDGGIGMGAERERPRERMERNQWGGSYQTGLNGTLGRGRGGGSHYTSSESVEISPHNQHTHSQSAVHSIRQMPAHRLSDRFDGSSAAQAGNTGTNTRGRYPIPSADDRPTSTSQLPAASFFPNTYSSPRSSSPASTYSSLGRGTSSVAKVTAVTSSAPVDGHVSDGGNKLRLPLLKVCSTICLNYVLSVRFLSLRLTPLRMDRENAESHVRELEDQLAGLQEELRRETVNKAQADTMHMELMAVRGELAEAAALCQKQEDIVRQRERELTALKGALKDEVSTHDKEIEALREQYSQDMERLRTSMEHVSQSQATIEAERHRVNSTLRSLQQQLEESRDEGNHWREQFQSSREELRNTKQDKQELEAEQKYETDRLKDQSRRDREELTKAHERAKQVHSAQTQANHLLQERTSQSIEAEQEQQEETKKLRQQLEESRHENSRLGLERDELTRNLEEKEKDRDSVRKENAQLEDQKRQQERALDKLNKEIERLSAASREEVRLLQAQLDEQKEKGRKEQQDSHKNAKEKLGELGRAQSTIHSLQEELARQKKELFSSYEDRDNALLDKELLTNRLKHLESEIETQRTTQNDRSREIRSLEDKIKHLQLELDEEKNNAEMLTERISRSRDQIEQLRAELMQERSSKQDLELDKNALERQIKDYKSRIADMEGQSRSSTGVSQLENKIQDLEERLRAEEREKSSVVSSQRRLERKLKELNITLDEERQQHTEQRDQLTLRVKALKRQVDEGEAEAERLDGLRRKAIREMEEMQEQKEAMQSKVTALENELKRKIQQARQSALESSVLSSDDDDDDGLYDHSSITSILTESNLQTSSC
uniref:Cingulin n=1 Tax=Sinocyclocheilus grahami TaxID=75366 RepID=A0A672KNX1_SINGR